jgi:hypothetical protein
VIAINWLRNRLELGNASSEDLTDTGLVIATGHIGASQYHSNVEAIPDRTISLHLSSVGEAIGGIIVALLIICEVDWETWCTFTVCLLNQMDLLLADWQWAAEVEAYCLLAHPQYCADPFPRATLICFDMSFTC